MKEWKNWLESNSGRVAYNHEFEMVLGGQHMHPVLKFHAGPSLTYQFCQITQGRGRMWKSGWSPTSWAARRRTVRPHRRCHWYILSQGKTIGSWQPNVNPLMMFSWDEGELPQKTNKTELVEKTWKDQLDQPAVVVASRSTWRLSSSWQLDSLPDIWSLALLVFYTQPAALKPTCGTCGLTWASYFRWHLSSGRLLTVVIFRSATDPKVALDLELAGAS